MQACCHTDNLLRCWECSSWQMGGTLIFSYNPYSCLPAQQIHLQFRWRLRGLASIPYMPALPCKCVYFSMMKRTPLTLKNSAPGEFCIVIRIPVGFRSLPSYNPHILQNMLTKEWAWRERWEPCISYRTSSNCRNIRRSYTLNVILKLKDIWTVLMDQKEASSSSKILFLQWLTRCRYWKPVGKTWTE